MDLMATRGQRREPQHGAKVPIPPHRGVRLNTTNLQFDTRCACLHGHSIILAATPATPASAATSTATTSTATTAPILSCCNTTLA